jgi:CxxC motif-containing protein (DUF1111 family)
MKFVLFGVFMWLYGVFAYSHSSVVFGQKNHLKGTVPLEWSHEDAMVLGKSFLETLWVAGQASTTARDGLGPLYNANTCLACHINYGPGIASDDPALVHRSTIFRVYYRDNSYKNNLDPTIGFLGDPVYGTQMNIHGASGAPFEGTPVVTDEITEFLYPDGHRVSLYKPIFTMTKLNYGPLSPHSVVGARRAPSLLGLGAIADIPEEQILARVGGTGFQGVQGKAQMVWSQEKGNMQLGRFGWKASASSIIDQAASALIHDMGLTNPFFPEPMCSVHQKECLEAAIGQELDVPMGRLRSMAFYLHHLPPPRPSSENSHHQEGRRIFERVGCVSCHVPEFLGKDGQTIRPYSDFLTHDMGKELSDGIREFSAHGNEWRTAPLWGIHKALSSPKVRFLHDGRARTIEEAILWHGGEATVSRWKFVHLKVRERQQLIDFVGAL